MPRPGEKVTLTFETEEYKRYTIAHLNEHSPKTLHTLEEITSGNILVAEYRVGENPPSGYFIGKRYDTKNGISDVLVLPKGDFPKGTGLMFEELYKLALKEAQKYAESKELEFEDRTRLDQEPKHL